MSRSKVEQPHAAVFAFLEGTPVEQTYLSVITLMEIRAGIEKLKPDSNKRVVLERWLTHKIPKRFPQRILPVTDEISDIAGRLLAAERHTARTPSIADLLIAATAKRYGMTFATLKSKALRAVERATRSFMR